MSNNFEITEETIEECFEECLEEPTDKCLKESGKKVNGKQTRTVSER